MATRDHGEKPNDSAGLIDVPFTPGDAAELQGLQRLLVGKSLQGLDGEPIGEVVDVEAGVMRIRIDDRERFDRDVGASQRADVSVGSTVSPDVVDDWRLCGGRLLATGDTVEMASSPGLRTRATGPSISLRRYLCASCDRTMLVSEVSGVDHCMRPTGGEAP